MMLGSASMDDEGDFSARKRFRRSRDAGDIEVERVDESVSDPRLYELSFPKDHEASFVAAIFELGLKHSSPKLIMPLMPKDTALGTEHIKSHLQKYRIHHQRSKEEFLDYYDHYVKESFHHWEANRGWEVSSRQSTPRNRSNSVSSNQSNNTTTGSVSDRYKFTRLPSNHSGINGMSMGGGGGAFPPSRSASVDRMMNPPLGGPHHSFSQPSSGAVAGNAGTAATIAGTGGGTPTAQTSSSYPTAADLLLRSESLLAEWRNSYQDTLMLRERMSMGLTTSSGSSDPN